MGPATGRSRLARVASLRQSLKMEDMTCVVLSTLRRIGAPPSASTGCSTCSRTARSGQAQENYPPFDLIKLGENEYRIELAVAGFKPDEIDITAQQNVLIVSGRKNEESSEKGTDYIYRGIANRSFERRFALADHIQVRGADLKDGLLAIELVREIPEAMKPRKINIGGRSARTLGDRRRRAAACVAADGRRRGRERLNPALRRQEAPGSLALPGAFSLRGLDHQGRVARDYRRRVISIRKLSAVRAAVLVGDGRAWSTA